MGSSVVCSSQQGFMGGGRWEMVMAYLMVAVDKHASLLLRLTWIGLGIDLVGSRVLPIKLYRWTLRSFNVTTQTELLQGFKGSRTKCLLKSKAET